MQNKYSVGDRVFIPAHGNFPDSQGLVIAVLGDGYRVRWYDVPGLVTDEKECDLLPDEAPEPEAENPGARGRCAEWQWYCQSCC